MTDAQSWTLIALVAVIAANALLNMVMRR